MSNYAGTPFEEVRDVNDRLERLLYTLTGTDAEYFDYGDLERLKALADEVVDVTESLLKGI